MRLIDADETLKEIDELFHKTNPDGEEQIGFLKCRRIVREASTIEAEPVEHGKWDDEYKCTNCGIKALCEEKPDPYHPLHLLAWFYVDSDYCPHCGARMDLED